jgi:Mrp family chromosome partitioning ATPase
VLSLQEPLSQVIVKSGNLSCVTSGPIPPSPTELLSSSHELTEAAEHFDVVIIDSPPVLGLADAPVMSPLADGVLFVVEADRSRRGSLKTALRRLVGDASDHAAPC